MYTSLMLIAFSGLVGVADGGGAPAWQNDYYAAQKSAEEQKKPLAVFLAPGENGWEKLSREGALDSEVKQLLTGKYIPVFINTDTDAGKKLAQAFGLAGTKGIVISDRGGSLQAFWHEGDLANRDLVRNLERFSDPQMVVRTTETNATGRVSYYVGPNGVTYQSFYPTSYQSNYSGGSYCPTCSTCAGGVCRRR
jgi:hypothetical protein